MCFACLCMCTPHVCLVPVVSEKGIESPQTIVKDGCEPPCKGGKGIQALCKSVKCC